MGQCSPDAWAYPWAWICSNNKTCNLDCVYCELGRTACLTSCRDRFVPPSRVLKEIELRRDEPFDHLTFAGSGEPTLSLDLGEVVSQAKKLSIHLWRLSQTAHFSLCLLSEKKWRQRTWFLPSLDAASQRAFAAINRPAPGLLASDMIQGLKDFRKGVFGERSGLR